jgi:nucleotide-binding universal stress UspA family protein
MSTRYIVGCDGSPASARALALAVAHAKSSGAVVTIAHVLEWSPYSFLTPEEIEERHKKRNEELSRAKQHIVDPELESLADSGVEVDCEIRFGHVAETLAKIAEESGAEQIFIGRTGQSTLANRIFGSVASSMAQIAPVPCTIVP